VQGSQKVWPTSVEFQIIEGGTGDFWMTDGGALTGPNDVRVTGPPGSALKIDRIGKGPWNNVAGYRDPVGELEKPMASGICWSWSHKEITSSNSSTEN